MSRSEFSAKVKDAAWLRCGGYCEIGRVPHMPRIGCGRKLATGDINYDHIDPDGLTGAPTLENCAVLCRSCHKVKTTEHDVPAIALAKRRVRRHAGIGKSKNPMRGWQRFDGTPVRNPKLKRR